MTGTKHWKIDIHLPDAQRALDGHEFQSTLQLGRKLGIHGRLAAAIFKRLGWQRWSGRSGGARGVVYMRPTEIEE